MDNLNFEPQHAHVLRLLSRKAGKSWVVFFKHLVPTSDPLPTFGLKLANHTVTDDKTTLYLQ